MDNLSRQSVHFFLEIGNRENARPDRFALAIGAASYKDTTERKDIGPGFAACVINTADQY